MNRPRFRTYRHKRETQSAHLITRLENRFLTGIQQMRPGARDNRIDDADPETRPAGRGADRHPQAQAVDRAIAAPGRVDLTAGCGQRAEWTVSRPAKQPRSVWYRRLLKSTGRRVSASVDVAGVFGVAHATEERRYQGSCRGAAWIGAMETPSAKAGTLARYRLLPIMSSPASNASHACLFAAPWNPGTFLLESHDDPSSLPHPHWVAKNS